MAIGFISVFAIYFVFQNDQDLTFSHIGSDHHADLAGKERFRRAGLLTVALVFISLPVILLSSI